MWEQEQRPGGCSLLKPPLLREASLTTGWKTRAGQRMLERHLLIRYGIHSSVKLLFHFRKREASGQLGGSRRGWRDTGQGPLGPAPGHPPRPRFGHTRGQEAPFHKAFSSPCSKALFQTPPWPGNRHTWYTLTSLSPRPLILLLLWHSSVPVSGKATHHSPTLWGEGRQQEETVTVTVLTAADSQTLRATRLVG